jgi:hypothetical protein
MEGQFFVESLRIIDHVDIVGRFIEKLLCHQGRHAMLMKEVIIPAPSPSSHSHNPTNATTACADGRVSMMELII